MLRVKKHSSSKITHLISCIVKWSQELVEQEHIQLGVFLVVSLFPAVRSYIIIYVISQFANYDNSGDVRYFDNLQRPHR